MLIDGYGRIIDYLRISLTEACNFRCVYCLPKEGFEPLPTRDHLTGSEIVRLVALFAELGVRKIRLTGGEPLLRKDVVDIVGRISALGMIDDLSLTTNGSLLPQFLKPLQRAGLHRLNISLDSLSPKRFAQVTASSQFQQVFAAVHQALRLGFPVKLNTLILNDLSEHEAVELARLAMHYPLEVRFLEFMPLCGEGWTQADFRPVAQIRSDLCRIFQLVEEPRPPRAVAQTFRIPQGKGTIGFISSVTEPFCNTCSRIRLTADGTLRPCLFSPIGFPLKHLLRNDAPDTEILSALRNAVAQKPKGNAFYDPLLRPNGGSLIRSLGG